MAAAGGPGRRTAVTGQPPVVVGEREWDGSLWWSVLASGVLHLLAVAIVLLVPRSFAPPPPPLVSYSVDLVAPDRVGGTNMVAGGKGRVQGPALTTVAPPAPKPVSKVEQAKPPEPPPPVEVASKPEPPPPPPKAEEPPKAEPKPEPKVEEKPKPEEKAKDDEMALAEKARKVPSPRPTVAKPAPTVPAKPAPSPQAKPAPTAPAKAAPSAKVVAQAPAPKASQVVAQVTPVRAVTPAGKPAARVAAATPGTATDTATRERDARIAAAVRRVEQQVGVRGGGTGQSAGEQPGGGPIAVGPGEGVGGALRGFEYLMYYNQLQTRIKQSWAWAGGGPKLEADVRLNIAENGEISNVRTVRSSGDAGFDASVERAVRAVNPLPPPPEAYRKEFADVVLSFSSEQLFQ